MLKIDHELLQIIGWHTASHRYSQFLVSGLLQAICKQLAHLLRILLQRRAPFLAQLQSLLTMLVFRYFQVFLASLKFTNINVLSVHINCELTFPQVNCTMNY